VHTSCFLPLFLSRLFLFPSISRGDARTALLALMFRGPWALPKLVGNWRFGFDGFSIITRYASMSMVKESVIIGNKTVRTRIHSQ
jgi:hypothetical protein